MKASTLAREDELNRLLLIEVYNWFAANESCLDPFLKSNLLRRRIHKRLYGPLDSGDES